jgi:hypothetical protein
VILPRYLRNFTKWGHKSRNQRLFDWIFEVDKEWSAR